MAVDPSITEAEMDYAGAVLQKTYAALLHNELDAVASSTSYCDPYCRTITSIQVEDVTMVDPTASGMKKRTSGMAVLEHYTKQLPAASSNCTQELEVVFAVEGTWVGCTGSDDAFPGLFNAPAVVDNIFDKEETGRRRRRLSASLRRRSSTDRNLQDCGSCPDDNGSLGMVAPSAEALNDVMEPFITVLPAICDLISIELVEGDAAVGETQDDGPDDVQPASNTTDWTPVDCPISFSTENCVDLLSQNRDGVVPCSCDGRCLVFAGGSFVGCNEDGGLNDVNITGSMIVDAAGCTLAEHVADIAGFTCL
jgi:hypothetical protein